MPERDMVAAPKPTGLRLTVAGHGPLLELVDG